jgi:hypothetical protein
MIAYAVVQRHKDINIFTVYRHKELKYRGTTNLEKMKCIDFNYE